MSGNNKRTHTKTRTKTRLDPGLWNLAIYGTNKAQEKIIFDLDLNYEDEMECDYREPTSNEVISQCENERKSPLTDDERFMIYVMYEQGIKCDLTFGEFCDKYYGYDEYDDQYDDEYLRSLEQKTINNIDSSK